MAHPIFGSIWSHPDGSKSLAFDRDGEYRLRMWPGPAAAITKLVPPHYSEAFSTRVHGSSAWLTASIEVDRHVARKAVRTRYASGTVREDSIVLKSTQVNRFTQWRYPNGTQAKATYRADGRRLTVTEADRYEDEIFDITGKLHGPQFKSMTKSQGLRQGITILRTPLVDTCDSTIDLFPDSSWHAQQASARDPGQILVGTRIVSRNHNGAIEVSQISDRGQAVHSHRIGPQGTISSFMMMANPSSPTTPGDPSGQVGEV